MDQGDYYSTGEDGGYGENRCQEIWEEELARKDRDLMEWLNEFLESDEFKEYIQRRKNRKNKKTYVSDEMLQENVEGVRLERMQNLHEKLKRALKKNHVPVTLANQQVGISVIREKIYEARRKYLKRRGEKKFLERNDREEMIKILKTEYGIDLPWLDPKSKLVDRVICVRKKENEAIERKRKNTLAIVEKLLKELKREKYLKGKTEKIWNYKKSEGKVMPDFEVIGNRMILYDRTENEPSVRDGEQEEALVDLQVDTLKAESTKKKGKADKKRKDKVGKNKKVKAKKTKQKTDKKSRSTDKKNKKKSQIKGEMKVVIPVPPILNTRAKIEGENCELLKLLNDFDNLQAFLIDQQDYEIERMMEDRLIYDVDHEIEATPSKIIFKNFINGNSYKMRVNLKNTSSYIKKLNFDKIIWNADIDDDLLLEVEPLGTQKLLTGLSFSFTLRFNPETLQKSTEAKVVFLTYKPNSNTYHQYVLYVLCTPHCSEITVSPSVISFEEVPIWRAKKMQQKRTNYKILKVKNSGSKECRIVITKIFNPITIEHEWRNLISIMNIEDSNSQSITSSDLGPEDVREDRFPRNLLEECVENVFNNFRFDRMVFNVPGNSEKSIKVWLRNLENTGFFVETYTLSVYERYPDEKLYCIGNQDLVVNAELSGHFLTLAPDLLDFEVCAFDSVYQLSFDIFNPTNLPHNVRIKFPSTLREYLTCTTSDITVQPGQYHKVHLKFCPRSDFAENNKKYHDCENDVFEYPVYVVIYTRNFEDTPPMIIDVFAALTDPLGLVVVPKHEDHVSIIENEYLLDLGQCNTSEAIFAELKIQNTSLVPQHYAFVDLPPCITIYPNYGFGYLQPLESKHLKLYFQPKKEDLLHLCPDEFEPNTVLFSIEANTVKRLGSLKKELNMKKLNKKLKNLENAIKHPKKCNEALEQDMETMCHLLRKNITTLYPETYIDDSSIFIIGASNSLPKNEEALARAISRSEAEEKVLSIVEYDDTSEKRVEEPNTSESWMEEISQEGTFVEPNEVKCRSNRLWLKGCITRTLCEFSHQRVTFPDTPCGSYSVLSIELRTLKQMRNCKAKFEIYGSSEEICIEPNVGELIYGEKIKLYLVARPQTPQHVIEEKAAALKVAEAIEMKRRDLETKTNRDLQPAAKRGKSDLKGIKKNKKKRHSELGGGKDDKKSIVDDNVISINEKDIVYGYFDYYPAEMCVWRSLEPYLIEADFRCEITYTDPNIETEKLYLKAECRVVRPNFIHDRNLQEINFETVTIGGSRTEMITLQNIQRRRIVPKINPLNPKGCFSTSEFRDVSILPEFLLRIPITYTPQTESDNEDIEFFEIVCEETTYPFILKGRGVFPVLAFKPEFRVSRVNITTQCCFEIANLSECPIEVTFRKVCELDGTIQENPESNKTTNTSPALGKPGKLKKAEKSSKSSKSKQTKEKNRPKYSENLMEDEIYSLENLFTESVNPYLFKLTGKNSQEIDSFIIQGLSKTGFKIQFGLPDQPAVKTGKGVKGKKDADSSKSKKNVKKDGNKSFCIAKYVVTIGKREFLKDFIVIGSFNN